MSIILKEFDHSLEKSEIVMPIMSSSKQEAGDNYQNEKTDVAQTSVFGVQVPLIMINNTIIDFDDVKFFSISSVDKLPELTLTVIDKFELITNLDKPEKDNEVRIQILPKFEDVYKKINLTFYISDITVNGSLVRLTCTYKLPYLTSSQYKSFGELDTYTFFRNIALDTKLGFASNISELTDKRYIYCDNKSLLEIMTSEIELSESSNHILDWWIDFWDNINLADIKERYNTVDPDELIKIWVTGECSDITIDKKVEPIQATAVISNYPHSSSSELFFNDYQSIIQPGSYISEGTDIVYSIYNEIELDYNDYLVQDGDVKEDIFLNYEYVGENYGDYNYILSKYLRNTYIRKMNSECIKVTMPTPVLGLMRGHKVNFLRYVNDEKLENKLKSLEENEIINRNVESNIPLSKYDIPKEERLSNGNFILDRTVSAQYLISAIEMIYENNQWKYVLTLIKPASTNVSIINE